ncbi:MAG: SMP-30/gluconolactonase/LRE family protein [Caulobacterales bacterium]
MTLTCVAPVGDQCGEAATWSIGEQALYWTDVNCFLVHRMDWASRAVRTWLFDEPCVALFLTPTPGVLIVALGSRLIVWTPNTDERRDFGFAERNWPEVRLNDGRPGPGGEIWIGSMANNVAADGAPGACEGFAGSLYRVCAGAQNRGRAGALNRGRAGAQALVVKSGIGIANTVCFSPDRRHFYFGDSKRNTIWRFDIKDGEIGNETVFFEGFDRGVPDGSTVDAEGYLWNCRFGGGCVVRVAPNGGVDRIIEMPVSNITTCEFGGPDLRTLFITTAAMMTPKYERLAGSLFALDVPAAGMAALAADI